jgi:serine/threonine-protein kinase
MVAERYRIVGLLGRGGMGEVYRADDLKLGQPVALKFLPPGLADDQDRLDRFLNEVRIARQVSHPNVCRVYDVGETEGQHYLSMEYVDGEDLATLLKRIGRLPEDKAVQIARQLCAGLAAAHELGILHRDLKPANVMLDGRGRAKLTDFGLAGFAQSFEGGEVYAGTPTYMSPEQIAGEEVSTRSDIYSLGLVLYELFTGKRAFDAQSLAELKQKQLESAPTTPSSFMSTFDPAIERVLLHCLEKEPNRRPASALAVAAALPGGDPLAAALAAGETPSPEMVAAAGPQGGLPPGVAVGCLVAVLLLSVLNVFPARSLNPHDHLPFTNSYQALKANAREIAVRLGYDDVPSDSWAGFGYDFLEYFHLIQEYGPASLVEPLSQPGQTVFWMDYRQDDGPITPLALDGRVSWSTPAPNAGEVAMEVDLQGHLAVLRVTPSPLETEEEAREVDWAALFEAAGLDIEEFEPVNPTTRPDSFADTRMAWTGALPDYGDRLVRIEAAALDGKPISFRKIISSDWRWTTEGAQQPEVATGFFTAAAVVLVAIGVAIVGGALFLAVRNLKLGRGDRKGAFRIAAFVFTMRSMQWALSGDHVGHPSELSPLAVALSGATTLAFLSWIVYVACEPYVRRLWPEALVSWTRVLAGRLRDPLVGRDVLIGCTFASIQGLVIVWAWWIGEKAGIVGLVPIQDALVLLRGGRYAVGELFATFLLSTAFALGIMMVFLLLRMICRKTWIAGTVLCVLWGAITALSFAGLFGPQAALFGLLFQAFNAAVVVVLLARFGLLAAVAGTLFAGLGRFAVFTLDTSSPLFGIGLFVTAVSFALAIYGWQTSLAGRPLMKDPLPRT